MIDAEPEPGASALPPHLRAVALVIGGCAALLGLITAGGWLFDVPALVQIHPSVAPMVLHTALCFLLTGFGLLALPIGSRFTSRGCGVVVAVLAALALGGYLTNPGLPLDQPTRPVRMAPNTATAFLVVGLALALAGRRAHRVRAFVAGGAAGILVLSLSTVALVGYLFRIQPAFGWGRMIAMSPQTAVGLAFVGFAVVSVVGRLDLTVGHQRKRWLAFVVGSVGATTTLLLWQALAADHERALRFRVDAETLSIRHAVSLSLQSQADALKRLAHRWQGRAAPVREVWEDDAGSYVKDFPGVRSIAWVDSRGTTRWMVPLAGNETRIGTRLVPEGHGADAVEVAGRGNGFAIAGRGDPIQAGGGLFVLVPLLADAGQGDFMVAEMQGAPFLGSVLSGESRLNHQVSLLLEGALVGLVAPGSPLSTNLQSRTDWSLLGQPWSIQVVPTDAWASTQRPVLPLGALCGGLFFSVLLAWSVLKTGEARLGVIAAQQSEHALRREAAERRVAEQERDRFFSLSIDMLCVSNADGYFKRLNPAFEQTLGYTVEELKAHPFLDFVHPDDVAATLQEVDKQVSQGLPTMHFENRYRCKDGTYRWLAWKSTPDVTSGMMFALARDVTHERLTAQRLEASEERYRGLVEAATDIIYRTDPAGRFEFVNAVAVRVMGYSQEELLGMHFTELVRPDQREEVRAWYEAEWGRRVPPARREFPAVARDGHEVWIEQAVQPVMEDDRIVAFQAIARDVTLRKSMEAERERLIAELQSTITQVRTLSEMLPMCSGCRRIRDDEDGSWHQLEKYLSKTKSGTQVSHGICPECTRELYPDYARKKEARERKGTP